MIITQQEMDSIFRSEIQAKRFIILYTIAYGYHNITGDDIVSTKARAYHEEEALRLNYPNGWQEVGNYDELLQWYLKIVN